MPANCHVIGGKRKEKKPKDGKFKYLIPMSFLTSGVYIAVGVEE